MNVSEAFTLMKEGKMVCLSNSDVIFKLYHLDMVVMMVKESPITMYVCVIETSEEFLDYFSNKTVFKVYESQV